MSKLWKRRVRITVTGGAKSGVEGKTDSGSLTSAVSENLPQVDRLVFEQGGSNPTDLKITFDVNYPGIAGYYISEVVIYNLSKEYANIAIMAGSVVSIEAGYEDSDSFGLIFKGYLYHPMWEREDVINYKLTLRCIDGSALYTDQNFIGTTIDKGTRFDTRMNMLRSSAIRQIPMTGTMPTNDKFQEFERQETIFGTPARYFEESYNFRGVGELGNTAVFSSGANVTFVDLNDIPCEKEAIVISPNEGGLIGTPQQTIYGANFVCLLNPSLRLKVPAVVVKLENTSFIQMTFNPGTKEMPARMTPTLEFMVIGVRHVGDTRGVNWYTYVTGCNLQGAMPTNLDPKQFRG